MPLNTTTFITTFPEMKMLFALKIGNAHFAKLFNAYYGLTDSVEDLEQRSSPSLILRLKK